MTVCILTILAYAWAEPTQAAEKRRSRHRVHNLPAIVDVPESHWSFAEELNLSDAFALSNTTLDYGIDENLNVGWSLLNATLLDTQANPYWDPDILLNVEKTFVLGTRWALVFGTQIGLAPWDDTRSTQIEHFTYVDNQIPLADRGGALHTGLYLANGAMSGLGTVVGFLFGAEIVLRRIPFKLNLDYVSGRNNLSTLTLTCHWLVMPRLEFGWGVQLAAPGDSDDATALVGLYWH